jgi:hypothetical protein
MNILRCDICDTINPSDTSSGWGALRLGGGADMAWKLQARQATGDLCGVDICPECVVSLKQWRETRRANSATG